MQILFFLLAIAGASIYALTNGTSTKGLGISSVLGSATGYVADIKTDFTSIVWNAAFVHHNGYALFFLAGLAALALVLLSNLTLTHGKAAVR